MTTIHHSAGMISNPTAAPGEKVVSIALAGQPNMGKSTLFNLLTGLNQHVGNWPGKTVEFREGTFHYSGRSFRLIDLPGTYSLTANSPEEVVAREFILREQPDVVVAVVSAANLERSLYLVSELICLPSPLVIALNMMDVAEQEGIHPDSKALETAIGVPVIPIVATRASGVGDLLLEVDRVLAGDCVMTPHLPEIRCDHRQALEEVIRLVDGYIPEPYPIDWAALKILEADIEMTRQVESVLPAERRTDVQKVLAQHDDAMLAIASGRYEWINRIIRSSVERPPIGQISLTDRLDRWATHPVWGLLILAGILALVFLLTFAIGSPLQAWLGIAVISPLAGLSSAVLSGAPAWVTGLVTDGIIGGAGSVLTFLPIMVIFFASFGLLEDVGYMARAAFVMDNFMHLMGLHGKSFLPLFLGFGCNVPAVMGTRVIDSKQARLLTILIAPLVPCTARMAVLAIIAPAFFGPNATLVSWGLIMLPLVILVLTGMLLNRLLFKGERSAFIMELPLYHIPNARTIGMLVWHRSLSFVKKAGTIILAFSVVIWVLSFLPGGDIQNSYLAKLGRFVAPVGQLMGMDWKLTVALLTGFIAKENSIATLGVLLGNGENAGLAAALAAAYTPATALAFLTVSLLFIPCVATVAVIKQETGSWKWTSFNLVMMLTTSILAGGTVYSLASAAGL